MHFCERHFQEDDIELRFISGDGKKRQLKLQVLPSRNFPKKSVETSTTIERRPLIGNVVEEAPQKVHVYAVILLHFVKGFKHLDFLLIGSWILELK